MASKKKKDYQGAIVTVDNSGNIVRTTPEQTKQTVTKVNSNTSNLVSQPTIESKQTVTMPTVNSFAQAKQNYNDKLALFNNASDALDKKRVEELNKRNIDLTRRLDRQDFKSQTQNGRVVDKRSLEQQQRQYDAFQPKLAELTQNETNNKLNARNDLKLARYQRDLADVEENGVNTFDKIVNPILSGAEDVLSPIINEEGSYKDENGNEIYLPSKSEIKYEKVRDSYGNGFLGDLARFYGDTTHELGKQAAASAINKLTFGVGGKALYFTDIVSDQYKQNINEGYDQQEALADAMLKAGSNYVKQKAMGGLSKLMGNTSGLEKTLTNRWAQLISNPRVVSMLSSMGAEALDEFTDTFVEAGIDRLVLGKKADLLDILKDAGYSGLIGGATGGVNGAIDVKPETIDTVNRVQAQKNAQANTNTQPNINTQTQQTPVQEQIQTPTITGQNTTQNGNTQTQSPQQLQLDIDNNQTQENNNLAETKSEPVIKQDLNKETDDIMKKFKGATEGQDVFKRVENEQGKPLRQGVKTITTATGTTELVSDMDGKVITYEPKSNQKTLNESYGRNRGKSLQQRYNDNIDFIKSDKRITADNIADIETLLVDLKNDFNKQENVDMFLDLVQQASTLGTTDAQALQFMSVIKRLSPETQLDTLIKMVENSKAKGEKTFNGVELNRDLVQKVLAAKDNEVEYNKAMDNLKNDIAKQMKVGFLDRVNAFRFLSMLGNVKTHGRNFFGNGLMYGLQSFKDTLGGGIESIYDKTSKALGGKGLEERTKTTFGSLRASKEIRNYVNNEVDRTFSNKNNNSKYNETNGLLNDVKGRRKMFTEVTPLGKVLNVFSNWNTKALDAEDKIFSKAMTKQAMKSYLVANGIKSNADIEANPDLVARALDYAVFKGQEATYHQDSKTATAINNFKETAKKGSGFTKAIGLGVEATMPFVKTPVNIAKTSLEYTPLIGFADLNTQLKNSPKELRGAIVIDNLSKQFAGLALAGVGVALASSGKVKIKGSGDGSKEDEIEKSLGSPNYSVVIGNNSYDLSWLAPTAIPLFEGVEMYDKLVKTGQIDANTLIDTLFGALDPVQDMSVLQSVERLGSSLFSNSSNKSNLIRSAAGQTFSSYLSQYIPTLFSQIAEFSDDTKRDAYTDKTVLGSTWNQIKYKIPGARQTLPESVDIWGETNKTASNGVQRFAEAFLSPVNRKDYKVDSTTRSLEALAKRTGTSVLPTKREQSVTVNGETYNLNGNEYIQYKKTFGKTAKKEIDALMKTDEYRKADDATKKVMIENLYKYANYKYKKRYADTHKIDYSNSQETKFAMVDAFNIPYYELESLRLGDDGKTKKQEKMDAIDSTNLTDEQKDMINLIQNYKYYDANINYLIDKINNSNLSKSQKEQLIKKVQENGTSKKKR